MRPSPVARASASPVARATVVPRWAAACFVASGAAGLLYEVVWSKQLAYLLGSSLRSAAIVVAAFLAGLALGARWLGAPLARGDTPGRRYALLEAAVAVVGFAVLPVLRALDPLVGGLYRALGGESWVFEFARAGLLFAILLAPAALMGATLPVLVARCERDAVGAGLAWLYALNTLGAVAGSLLGGFLLLPGLGLAQTTLVAAALNLFAALWAAIASGDEARVAAVLAMRAPAPGAVPGRPLVMRRRTRRWLMGMFAASGFAALALQIAWLRLFGLVLGSSVYSLSAVLGVYLCGLALGSVLVARWLPRVHGVTGFALLQLLFAASVAVGRH